MYRTKTLVKCSQKEQTRVKDVLTPNITCRSKSLVKCSQKGQTRVEDVLTPNITEISRVERKLWLNVPKKGKLQ